MGDVTQSNLTPQQQVISDLEQTLEIDLPDNGEARISTEGAIVVEEERADGNLDVVLINEDGEVYESSVCTPATDEDRYVGPFTESVRRTPPTNTDVIMRQTCHDFSFFYAGSVSPRKLEAARVILRDRSHEDAIEE